MLLERYCLDMADIQAADIRPSATLGGRVLHESQSRHGERGTAATYATWSARAASVGPSRRIAIFTQKHWREMMRSVKLRILGLLGTLALLFSFSLLTQVSSVVAAGPSVTPMSRTILGAQAPTAGSCALADSWCAFCTRAPDTAACQAFTPAHVTGTTTSGAQNNAGNTFVLGVTGSSSAGEQRSPAPHRKP